MTKYCICLSRATYHKPPCSDRHGFCIDEAASSASYLMSKGVNSSRILLESWSFDTIGNAYGARQLICEPMGLSRLMIVTSHFHMRRTRLLFDWIFSLPNYDANITDASKYHLFYLSVENESLTDEEVCARINREEISCLKLVNDRIESICSLPAVAKFIFVEHTAYKASLAGTNRLRVSSLTLSEEAKGTY